LYQIGAADFLKEQKDDFRFDSDNVAILTLNADTIS
jgi:hypothetical protein